MRTPSTLRDLLDLEELKRLKTRYVYALDDRQHKEVRSLFTDDATIEIDGVHYTLGEFLDVIKTVYRTHRAVHQALLAAARSPRG